MPDDLHRFSLPNELRFEAGQGGLTRAVITTPLAEAHVHLHGAHVTHYQAAGQKPLLFLSKQSHFKPDKAIRGGIPICFPWFGPKKDDPSASAHGFARLKEWRVESAAKADDGSVRLVLSLTSDAATLALWPFEFRARYIVIVGKELRTDLEVHNTGAIPFEFEAALHTYLSMTDVRKARIDGLQGVEYLDKVQAGKRERQGPAPFTITGETDRVYLNTRASVVVHDVAGQRNVEVEKGGSDNTVVWNPWMEKAKAMSDFGADECPAMLCIEAANVGESAVAVEPGRSQSITSVARSLSR